MSNSRTSIANLRTPSTKAVFALSSPSELPAATSFAFWVTAVVAANGRAQALQSAEQAAAAEQGREQRRRFLTPGTGYQPGNARMFPGSN